MCGRYVAKAEAEIERFWNIKRQPGNPLRFGGCYNAAPTQKLPVIRLDPQHGLELGLLRWGLVSTAARNARTGSNLILARGETVAVRPAFREAFRGRRCLIPMAGYYEWQQTSAGKVPHYFHLLNAEQFAVAGVYEIRPGADGAEPIESYAIITTAANEMAARIHDRMPAILPQHRHVEWLDPANARSDALRQLLEPFPAEEMHAVRVSLRVNSVKNDGPELIEPLQDPRA